MTENAIIPRTSESWQKTLADIITDPAELFSLLELDDALLPAANKANELFPLRVPRSFVAKMRKGDCNDPLLLQTLPLGAELKSQIGFSNDPLQENDFNPIPGLLHKYHNRVLLIVTGNCMINCRFCFRRHFPYTENNMGRPGLTKILTYLNDHPEIDEVIFSGGDPLIATDKMLKDITQQIVQIPHIKRLRIHTRIPIMAPARITTEFIEWFSTTRLQPILVLHCNHPNELDSEVEHALQRLVEAKVTLLNQSVLLKGVNDNPATLVNLSERLFACHVLPYYLHMLDKVSGTAHFEVTHANALNLIEKIRGQLPGYLVPKLVREDPGSTAKTIIT